MPPSALPAPAQKKLVSVPVANAAPKPQPIVVKRFPVDKAQVIISRHLASNPHMATPRPPPSESTEANPSLPVDDDLDLTIVPKVSTQQVMLAALPPAPTVDSTSEVLSALKALLRVHAQAASLAHEAQGMLLSDSESGGCGGWSW